MDVLLKKGIGSYLINKAWLTALELVIQDDKSDLNVAALLVSKIAGITSNDPKKVLVLKSINEKT
ncbi:MAG: hypothetical protein PV340_03620 [Wolbachia sp.]|nr:hypothetical protein [Wolbachia sp.]MDD9336206.1 hypothetical protein [Wolbachia sp.]